MTLGNSTLLFTYDTDGTPLTVKYNGNVYYYTVNLQGDVVAILNSSGTAVVSYTYDAWGNVLSVTGSERASLGFANPLRYRGYVYDTETGLYYLQSRYYNPQWGRFISADSLDVLTATPMSLTDKNLFAYCDNNPVMREDERGSFWFVSIVVGLATQYVGDVIGNLIDGKTGADIFKPTSSIGEYVAAGVTALVPGVGLGGALVRNIVTEGITTIEDVVLGNEVNALDSMINIGFGTVLDAGFEKMSDKAIGYISSKMPQNYSSFAHKVRESGKKLTREQIYRNMQRSIRFNRVISKTTSFGFDVLRSCLPY